MPGTYLSSDVSPVVKKPGWGTETGEHLCAQLRGNPAAIDGHHGEATQGTHVCHWILVGLMGLPLSSISVLVEWVGGHSGRECKAMYMPHTMHSPS